MVAGLLRSKHGARCAAKGTSVAGRGYLRFDQELASHPRSRRSTATPISTSRNPPFQDVGPMAGAVHPGLEPAIMGAFSARAPGDILSAEAPVVAVATEALAWTFVAALGVVREVIAPDHVHRAGPGSLPELGVYAKVREPTAGAFPVVQV